MYFIEYNRLVLEEPNIYHNLGELTRSGDRVGIVRILLGVIFGGCLF